MRLRSKLFALNLGSLLATAFFIAVLSTVSFRRHLDYEFHLRSVVLTRSFLHVASEEWRRGAAPAVENFLDSLMADPDVEEAEFLAPTKEVMASKRRAGVPPSFQARPDLFTLALQSLTPQFATVTENGQRYELVYQRIWREGSEGLTTLGVGFLKFGYYRIDRQWQRLVWTLMGIVALFTGMALIASFLFSGRLIDPIEQLRRAAEALGRGDFQAQLPLESGDEIGVLARTFQAMAQEVRSAREYLEERIRERTRELEASQAALLKSEKLATIGQLAASMAHEIRNPLGAIKNALYYIRDAVKGSSLIQEDPALPEFMDLANTEIQTATQIITDLLDYSRTLRLTPKATDINETLQYVKTTLQVPANVKIIEALEPGLPPAMVDPEKIRQVFVNLATNAIQAMPHGGELRIATRVERKDAHSSSWMAVDFVDSGEGMSKETMSKIFEPLFSTKNNGTGLGLPICLSIAQAHGGKIQVASDPGKGSTFTVLLPLGGNTNAS